MGDLEEEYEGWLVPGPSGSTKRATKEVMEEQAMSSGTGSMEADKAVETGQWPESGTRMERHGLSPLGRMSTGLLVKVVIGAKNNFS